MKINVEYYSRRCLLGLIWAMAAIFVYITYRILGIADLAVEGTLAMGAAIAANSISNGLKPYLATLLALLGGLAAGQQQDYCIQS